MAGADDAVGFHQGNTVTIDVNAAGRGWFVDLTPVTHDEFNIRLDRNLLAAGVLIAARDLADAARLLGENPGWQFGYEVVPSDGTCEVRLLPSGPDGWAVVGVEGRPRGRFREGGEAGAALERELLRTALYLDGPDWEEKCYEALCRKFRVRGKATREEQAYYHAWRVVGYLMGVDERLLPDREKLERADFAYVNTGTLEDLDAWVAGVMQELTR